MGSCFSVLIKDESPLHAGAFSKYVTKDGKDFSYTSSKFSSPSIPLTPRSQDEILKSSNLKSFGFNELKVATRNFHRDSVLGERGFGCFFEGWIDEHTFSAAKPGTGLVIAVKYLRREGFEGHKEWLAEINYLGQLYHPNLVKLIGYCLEDERRLLVYEFIPRGSLENHLFRRSSYFQPLSWSIRMKVALGAAKGLAYLHSPEAKVICGDIKASNILLDSNFNAKLSDFGLAKDGPIDGKSHASTRVAGTYGYAAPEYTATGILTTKSDVYSFGVILLELLTGRRVVDRDRVYGQQFLVLWAMNHLTRKGEISGIMDSQIEGQYTLSRALKAAHIAMKCLATDPQLRPDMDKVVKALKQLQD